ncbi:MAG TPA: hypothetical protein VNB54_07180, partial [Alphaproteobacteria bacterium]|nr:hypothetical protein [Alphaproteobacteria bacterium]
PTLEQAKGEIVRILIKQHVEKQEQAMSKSMQVEFNEKYVGPAQPSGLIPAGQLKTADGHVSAPQGSSPKSGQPK